MRHFIFDKMKEENVRYSICMSNGIWWVNECLHGKLVFRRGESSPLKEWNYVNGVLHGRVTYLTDGSLLGTKGTIQSYVNGGIFGHQKSLFNSIVFSMWTVRKEASISCIHYDILDYANY